MPDNTMDSQTEINTIESQHKEVHKKKEHTPTNQIRLISVVPDKFNIVRKTRGETQG